MSQPETDSTIVNIRNLVKVLGGELYDDPAVVLRELISNANDVCILAMSRFPEIPRDEFQIEVWHEGGDLIVRDNGLGMTRMELKNHLSTICNSDKREQVKRLREDGRPEFATRIIGQFGLGFLTTFAVSRKVTVETASRTTSPLQGWRWESTGDASYTLTPIALERPGTTVRMQLITDDPRFRKLGASMTVKQRVQQYSRHLSLPIYYGEGDMAELLNGVKAPWTASGSGADEEWKRYLTGIEKFSDAKEWIGAIPLNDDLVQGVLYFPYHWGTQDQPIGVVDIHCRGPLVEENSTTVVPRSFRCVRGIVQSPEFSVRVDRNAIKVDEIATQVQKRIEAALIAYFTRLAGSSDPRDRKALLEIVKVHGVSLLEGFLEIEDKDVFSHLIEMMPMNTTEFPATTVREIVERSRQRSQDGQQRMFYFTERVGNRQTAALVRKRGWELVDCSHPLRRIVLERYTQMHSIRFYDVANELDILFDIEKPEGGWVEIIDFYSKLQHPPYQLEPKLAVSQISEMPLTLLLRRGGEGTSDGSPVSGSVDPDRRIWTLYVVKNNPLMKQLADQVEKKISDRDRLALMLHELFHQAASFCDEPIESTHLFEIHHRTMIELATLSEQVAVLQSDRIKKRLDERDTRREEVETEEDGSVFVGLPFKEEFTADLYESGLKPVIQELGLKPIMLEEELRPGVVHDDIDACIRKACVVICDVTEPNANVYYEIGMAHGLNKMHKTLLVCNERELAKLPFNTQHLRILKYDMRPRLFDEFKQKVKQALIEITKKT